MVHGQVALMVLVIDNTWACTFATVATAAVAKGTAFTIGGSSLLAITPQIARVPLDTFSPTMVQGKVQGDTSSPIDTG